MAIGGKAFLLISVIPFILKECTIAQETHCPSIHPIRNGDITTSSRPPYKVGTVATFSCDTGFKGRGRSSIECLSNGRWSGSSPYCASIMCGKRDLKKLEKDRKCKKKCKKDKDCKGSFKTCECDDWCGQSCIDMNSVCSELKEPKNGYIVGIGRSYGQTVTYGCDDGYSLTGPSSRRCRSDGRWSGEASACVPFSACGLTGEDKSWNYGKVTKGSDAKPGAWPWQALLMFSAKYSIDQIYNTAGAFGGGSVINAEWVLSAAHVFDELFKSEIERKSWNNTFLLVMGMSKFPKKGLVIPDRIQIFKPQDVYLHPKYVATTFDYDVALIRIGSRLKWDGHEKLIVDSNNTEAKITYTHFIRPVCLPCIKGDTLKPVDLMKNFDAQECSSGKAPISARDSVIVTGFGHTSHDANFSPENLQEGRLKIKSNWECSKTVMKIRQQHPQARFTKRMFCASGRKESAKTDACRGDSGGPVVKRVDVNEHVFYWKQVGVVSWGVECGGTYPGFYMSVQPVMDWIWKTVNESRNAHTHVLHSI